MPITRRSCLGYAAGALAPALASIGAKAADTPRSLQTRLVVLDVGGTIIQDRGDVPEAMIDSCAHHGIRITPEDVAPFRGASKREVIRGFVERKAPKDADHEKLATAIYAEFNEQVISVYRSVPPIDGAEAAFRALRSSGVLLAATTGFGRAVADSIFKRLNWQEYFVAVVTGDDIAKGRPAPFMIYHAMEAAQVVSVRQVMAIGDTPLDLQSARNGGVAAIGVLTGAGTEEKLQAENPVAILPSVAALPAWLHAQG